VAFPLGTGMEYWANPINPADAALAIGNRSTSSCKHGRRTDRPPITGDFYTYRYLNPWPPAVSEAASTLATLSAPAARRPSNSRPSSASVIRRCSSAKNNGRSNLISQLPPQLRPSMAIRSGPSSSRLQVITYGCGGRRKSRRGKPFLTSLFFEDALRTTPTFLARPAICQFAELKKRAALADKLHGGFSFDKRQRVVLLAVGTADQVVAQLEEWGGRMGTSHYKSARRPSRTMPHGRW